MRRAPLLTGIAVAALAVLEGIAVALWRNSFQDAYGRSGCSALPPPAVCNQLASGLALGLGLVVAVGIVFAIGIGIVAYGARAPADVDSLLEP